jgi:hypothetical protein
MLAKASSDLEREKSSITPVSQTRKMIWYSPHEDSRTAAATGVVCVVVGVGVTVCFAVGACACAGAVFKIDRGAWVSTCSYVFACFLLMFMSIRCSGRLWCTYSHSPRAHSTSALI